MRTVLALARVEAWRLARNGLVLAGLVAGSIVVWEFVHRGEPLWWSAAWEIGYGQVVLSMTVLAAAQLATGRVKRDGMQDVYASLPVSATTRTFAYLLALVGGVPASLVLIGAAAAFLAVEGDVIGTPSPAVLVGGVVLVPAAGAIGVAIGSRFPHPLAGLLGAIVWFVPTSQSNRVSGPVTWLFPWVIPEQLKSLPWPVAGYPPGLGHAAELAGVAVLAGAIALIPGAKARRSGLKLMAVGASALAVICIAAALQLQPVRTADLARLVDAVGAPASAQHCTVTNDVRYCLYPGFDTVLPSLRAPVTGVLALLPARPARTLTVSQAATLSLDDAALTHGHSTQQLAAWNAKLQRAPANTVATSAIYVTVGSWPSGGAKADARFDVAFAAAEWAVGLPTGTADPSEKPPCVALDQAREAIAIWLAVVATRTPLGPLVPGGGGAGHGGYLLVPVANTFVVGWNYPGESDSYLASFGVQTTAAGYLLARAMTGLPTARVTQVLRAGWSSWSNWHSTDARLAAALGIAMPTVPVPNVNPRTGRSLPLPPAGSSTSQPVCTT